MKSTARGLWDVEIHTKIFVSSYSHDMILLFVCRPLDVPGSDHGSWLQVAEVQQDEVSTLTDVVNLDAGQHAAASESSKYGTGRTLTCRCDRQKAALPPSTCRHGPGAGSSTAHAAPPGTTQRYRDCCMVPHVDRGTHPESQAPLMTSEGLLWRCSEQFQLAISYVYSTLQRKSSTNGQIVSALFVVVAQITNVHVSALHSQSCRLYTTPQCRKSQKLITYYLVSVSL